MKKLFTSISILMIIGLSLCVSSCDRKTSNTALNDSSKIDTLSVTISIDSTYAVDSNDKYSPYLNLSIVYDYPVLDSALFTAVNNAIFDSIAQPTAEQTLKKYSEAIFSSFLANSEGWREYLDTTFLSSSDTVSADFRVTGQENIHTLNISKVYSDNRLTSYLASTYGYLYLAAHGYHYNDYVTIDLHTNKRLRDADIFDVDYKDAVGRLIVKQLMKQYKVTTFEGLVDEAMILSDRDNILPNNNFYISNEGLVYCFNEYEISAYAAGAISVTIPFIDLRNLVPTTSPIYYLVNQ